MTKAKKTAPTAANKNPGTAADPVSAEQPPQVGDAEAGDSAGTAPAANAVEAEVDDRAGAKQVEEVDDVEAIDTLDTTPENDDANAGALHEVLAPFWFRGGVLKPPARIRMDAAEAFPYQEAGVLGPAQVTA